MNPDLSPRLWDLSCTTPSNLTLELLFNFSCQSHPQLYWAPTMCGPYLQGFPRQAGETGCLDMRQQLATWGR